MKVKDSNGNWQTLKVQNYGIEQAPIGSMIYYPSQNIPNGYLLCDGSEYLIADYPLLFNAIGYIGGTDVDTGWFRVPNMEGVVPGGYHPDVTSGHPLYGEFGDQVGNPTHTLSVYEIPSHTHKSRMRNNGRWEWSTGSEAGDKFTGTEYIWDGSSVTYNYLIDSSPVGGGQAHPIVQPTKLYNWIIKAKNVVTLGGYTEDFEIAGDLTLHKDGNITTPGVVTSKLNYTTTAANLPAGNDDRTYWNSLKNGIYWYGNTGSVANMPSPYGWVLKMGFTSTGDFNVLFFQQTTGPIWRKSGNTSSVSSWYKAISDDTSGNVTIPGKTTSTNLVNISTSGSTDNNCGYAQKGDVVLRHNDNDTILSAKNGKIIFRPEGNTGTAGQNELDSFGRLISRGIKSLRGFRPTNANIAATDEYTATMEYYGSTSSMTSNKPGLGDGHILHFHWDNTGGWDSQLYLKNSTGQMMSRGCDGGTWGSWASLHQAHVLYNNSSGTQGTVTLNSSAANFSYLEVFYGPSGGTVNESRRIFSPNGKIVRLTYYSSNSWYYKTLTMNGTSVTVNNYGRCHFDDAGTCVEEDGIYVYKILGYR